MNNHASVHTHVKYQPHTTGWSLVTRLASLIVDVIITRNLFSRDLFLRALISSVFVHSTVTSNNLYASTSSVHSVAFVEVKFSSASYTHTPSRFKIRQAQKMGVELVPQTEEPIPLLGLLSLPDKDKPSPAIVILHTCAGLTEHEKHWSTIFVSWGYAVLLVDSLATRAVDYICDDRPGSPSPWSRALDAHGGKTFLENHPAIDAKHISVFGLSHGAASVIESIAASLSTHPGYSPFRSAIALYPLCSVPTATSAALLIISGSKDTWTPAGLCREYQQNQTTTYPVEMEVLQGAYHAFDHPDIDIVEMGHVVRSNRNAASLATELIRKFFDKHTD